MCRDVRVCLAKKPSLSLLKRANMAQAQWKYQIPTPQTTQSAIYGTQARFISFEAEGSPKPRRQQLTGQKPVPARHVAKLLQKHGRYVLSRATDCKNVGALHRCAIGDEGCPVARE